jgi:uncharacterized protein YbjT (DUF2867 family)
MIEGPEAEVVADTPLMEVESSRAGPDVATRFRRAVTHDNGGVFLFSGPQGFPLNPRADFVREWLGRGSRPSSNNDIGNLIRPAW